ncbi:MAG TPA: Gldg family protein [Chthoniobacteraceae bacterium]|jgi:hypothetical protein
MAKIVELERKQKVVQISRFQIGVNVLVQLLIVAAIVGMVNYLSFRHFKRWDFSRDQKYALSSQTKNLLGSLKKPVKAIIFFSSAAEIAPDVAALMREYEFASDKKFSTEIVDPFRNFTRASELQAKYKFGASENILILDYDGRNKFVNAADMAEFEQPDQMAMMMGQGQPKLRAFKGEGAVTGALLELTENRPNKVYATTGHGEGELSGKEMQVFSESLKRQNIQAGTLNLLNVSAIPEDARAVVLVGPKYDLSELEVKLLSDFWEKKGGVFVLLNPFAKTPRLAAWLADKGVTPQANRVLRTGTMLQMDAATGTPQLKAGTVTTAMFVVQDSRTKLTGELAGVSGKLLGATQSLTLDRNKEASASLKITPLLESAEGFWGETDNPVAEDRAPFFDPQKDQMGPLTLAVAVEKGGVADVKVDTSRLVVVGNSEILTNGGYQQSGGATMDLAMNALNWMLDREEIIGIPPREKKSVALSLSEKQLRNIAIAIMAVLPGTVALIGIFVGWRRRS